MKDFLEIFENSVIWTALIGWFIAQVLKVIFVCIKHKKLDFRRFVGSGGMPSSHSATVCALTTACAVKYGFASPALAISLVFSAIVMRDAAGVRWETGEQAKILNKITNELFTGNTDDINTSLKELVGHTPFQVVMGAVTGVIVAFALSFAFGPFTV